MEYLPQHLTVGTKCVSSHPPGIDPFGYLPLEIVGLINDALDPPDTERLRRVCRSWKVLSEALNGHGAIAKYCPFFSQAVLTSSKTPNEWFRWWLCCEQSLATGLAQSTIRFSKVITWDLRNDFLVVGSQNGMITVQALRSRHGLIPSGGRWLSLREIFRTHTTVKFWLTGVFVTAGGNIIVQLNGRDYSYLARITSHGKVIWFHNYSWSAVGVSSKFIYVLHVPYAPGNVLVLDTVNLADGTLRSASTFKAPDRSSGAFGNLKMVFSADEAFIAIKCYNQFLCIFDPSSVQLVDVTGWHTGPITAGGACWITSEPGTSNFVESFWKDGLVDRIFRYTHQTSGNIFTCKEIRNFPVDQSTPRGGVDIGRGLVFEDSRLDPDTWRFTVRRLQDQSTNRPVEDPETYYRFITVPDKQTGKRMDIESPTKEGREYSDDVTNFFGIYNDYLVYHHVLTGRFMVIDYRVPGRYRR